jgi:AcrR family transcriptional regulator
MKSKSLKAKMIENAYQMINDGGLDNFSARFLSKKLEVSHNAMYKHFKSKSELLFEIVTSGYDMLASAFIEIKKRTDIDAITKYKEMLHVYLEFALKNPHIYKLMYSFYKIDTVFSEDLINSCALTYKTATEISEAAIKTGKFKKASVLTITNTTLAFAHGLAMLLIDNILPKTKNLNSLPKLLMGPKKGKEASAREIASCSIDILFDGLTEKSNPE